jgi:hypothetical protein
MDVIALALGAALAVACVVFAARPFLREPAAPDDVAPLREDEREGLRLQEERDRALAALKELEFDHRTGKVSDDDYRELVRQLRSEAAAALRALDAARVAPPPASAAGVPVGQTGNDRRMEPSEPARVPDPWPPPDEGDVPDPAPTPAPGEPTPGPDEPAPPRQRSRG